MTAKNLRFLIVVIIAALFGYWVGVSKVSYDWKNYHPNIQVTSKEPPASLAKIDMTNFWAVFERLEEKYYDPTVTDPSTMVNGAINGMVQSLGDPFTVYLPPAKNTDFKQGMAGEFSGIGAELSQDGKSIVVISPLDGSPAEQAGIKPGDTILKINGNSTDGMTVDQAVTKIRGPKGTTVLLTVRHKDSSKLADLSITRNVITVKSVSGWVKPVSDIGTVEMKDDKNDSVMYIRLSQFGDNTNKDWVALVNKLVLQARDQKNFKGVVFDLRQNPGGYLTDAVFIASEFIKSGTVVIQDNGKGQQERMDVSRTGLLTNYPVMVLIDGGSASAAEIVSGALRDHGRAKLVGEKSYGKGTVQEAEDLGNGAGLHVTVAKWLTPNGTWVHKKGLTPDITVKLDPKKPTVDLQLQKAIETLLKG